MSVKDDKDVIIPLYLNAIKELEEDVLLVKNNETKSLINEEIRNCKNRLEYINNL